MKKTVYFVSAFQTGTGAIYETAKIFEHYRDAWAYELALSTNQSFDFADTWEVELY